MGKLLTKWVGVGVRVRVRVRVRHFKQLWRGPLSSIEALKLVAPQVLRYHLDFSRISFLWPKLLS